MRYDLSYGIIPLKKLKGEWQVCLVQLHAGHWGFPKGHPEKEESPKQAAARELLEETGLEVDELLSEETLEEQYFFTFQREKISKKVIYYLATVKGHIKLQPEEIADCRWFNLKEALLICTYPATKKICQQIIELIS